MKRPVSGDLFAVPLAPELYLTGRVVLDLRAQGVRRGLLGAGSHLDFFTDAAFVEIFSALWPEPTAATSAVSIPGLFVSWGALERGRWPVIGHRAVDPPKVELPEWLVSVGSEWHLVRGEVGRRVDVTDAEARAVQCRPTVHGSASIVDFCAPYVGRSDLARHPEIDNPLQWYDLRFSPHRQRIHALSGLDPDEPYASLSARNGVDVRRFFPKPASMRPRMDAIAWGSAPEWDPRAARWLHEAYLRLLPLWPDHLDRILPNDAAVRGTLLGMLSDAEHDLVQSRARDVIAAAAARKNRPGAIARSLVAPMLACEVLRGRHVLRAGVDPSEPLLALFEAGFDLAASHGALDVVHRKGVTTVPLPLRDDLDRELRGPSGG